MPRTVRRYQPSRHSSTPGTAVATRCPKRLSLNSGGVYSRRTRSYRRRMLSRSLAVALEWLGEGRRVVSATLVESIGSAPLEPGAEMLVDDSGRIEGSVTGGCVEGAL